MSDTSRQRRRQSLTAWMRANLRATDGPDAGQPVRLEPWQRGLLTAVDIERRSIVAVRAASQVGKTLLMLGVGLRGATVDGAGTLLASSTADSAKDLRRRLDRSLALSAPLAVEFATAHRRGPGAASWNNRQTRRGGWISLAAAGSPSQLASRTAAVAVADEIARWPHQVRSGEGHPLTLLRARLAGLGRRCGCWPSQPGSRNDAISSTTAIAGDSLVSPAARRRRSPGNEARRRGCVRAVRRAALRRAMGRREVDEDDLALALDSARASLAQVVTPGAPPVERGEPLALVPQRRTRVAGRIRRRGRGQAVRRPRPRRSGSGRCRASHGGRRRAGRSARLGGPRVHGPQPGRRRARLRLDPWATPPRMNPGKPSRPRLRRRPRACR